MSIQRRCQVIAHRGGSREVPENTRSSVEHTAALGLAWIETDLRCTRDGVVILAHDPSYARISGDLRPISSLTWDEVRQIDAGDGQPPMRLDEALRAFPDLSFNMDVKDEDVLAPAVEVVAQAQAWERTRFASFSSARLARLRRRAPQARTSLGMREVGALVGAAYAGLSTPPRRPCLARSMAALAGVGGHPVVSRRPDAVQVPVSHWRVPVVMPRFIAAAHARGLEVHVWTVDEPEQMRELASLHVDAVITDVPTLARQVLSAS